MALTTTRRRRHYCRSLLGILLLCILAIRSYWRASNTQPLVSSSYQKNKSKPSGTSSTTTCRRPKSCRCPTHVIWYNYGDQAGLDDRRQVLWSLANLAGLLCARLALPLPYHLLDAERHFTTVSPALGWKDLLQLSYLVEAAKDSSSSSCLDSRTNETTTNVLWEMRHPEQEFYSPKYDHYQRWTTRNPQDFWRHYIQVLNHYLEQEQRPILWQVKVSWHAVKKLPPPWSAEGFVQDSAGNQSITSLLEENAAASKEFIIPSVFVDSHFEPTTPGCLWIDPWGVPPTMQGIVNAVWNEILLANNGHDDESTSSRDIAKKNKLVGLLHVRRGDSKVRCDTSLDKIQSFLTCSLGTLSPRNHAPVVLLFASDETDEEYRQGMGRMISSLDTFSIQLIDLDALVWKHVRIASNKKPALESNYYVYAIESVLKRTYVDFVLEQRQTFCMDCQDLSRL